MEKLNLDRQSLKKFGITMGIAFLAISLLIFIKHRHSILPTSIISAIFFIFAFTMPNILKPIYVIWMRLAFILSWINTRIILFIVFYLIISPLGLLMRLFGADLLERKIDKQKDTYWIKKEKKEFKLSDYERQF
jgi:hypothetical protein